MYDESYGERPEVRNSTEGTSETWQLGGTTYDQGGLAAVQVERSEYPYPAASQQTAPEAAPATAEVSDGPAVTPLPTLPAYDPESESHVEVVVRVGGSQLIVRQEYPKGARDEQQVLRELVNLVEPYLEEGRI
jgi:hypothetical protein